jgi:hypothetical protein
MPTVDPRDAELAAKETDDRGLPGAIMDALWPILGGDMLPGDMWHDIDRSISEAIAAWNHRAHPAPEQSAHCSGEVVEGLRIAAGIVESDLCAAEETKDADWEGQSREALDAVNSAIAALSAPRPDEGVESLREIAAQKLPDELDNPEDADWREGYVGCVERARAALSHLTTPEKQP